MRTAALTAGLAAVVLGVSGCGSSSLSTMALRLRATRVCLQATRRENRIPTPVTTAQGAAFLKRGIAVLGPELKALRKLRPGGKAAPVYMRALSALAGELATLHESATALNHGADPVIEIKTLQQKLTPFEQRADEAWSTLMVPSCTSQ